LNWLSIAMPPAFSKPRVTIGDGLVLELVSADKYRTIYRCYYKGQRIVVKFWPWSRMKEEMGQVSRPAIPRQQLLQQVLQELLSDACSAM
jgi:hypothetical protein